jgi:hypothetical protein
MDYTRAAPKTRPKSLGKSANQAPLILPMDCRSTSADPVMHASPSSAHHAKSFMGTTGEPYLGLRIGDCIVLRKPKETPSWPSYMQSCIHAVLHTCSPSYMQSFSPSCHCQSEVAIYLILTSHDSIPYLDWGPSPCVLPFSFSR